ncbi:hypothetical protein D9M70_490440 [compost metagenome]
MAGGDTASAIAGAQAGRNAVENNELGSRTFADQQFDNYVRAGGCGDLSRQACRAVYENNLLADGGLQAAGLMALLPVAIVATPALLASARLAAASCSANPPLCANEVGIWLTEMAASEALPAGLAVGGAAKLTAEQVSDLRVLMEVEKQAGSRIGADAVGAVLSKGAKETGSASNMVLFERQRAGYAAQEIRNAQPIGSALKDDPLHRAPSYVIDQIPEKGRLFTIRGGDGKSYKLTQMEGAVDGRSGIFEWLVNSKGELTHQRFIPDGRITGTPNQIPSRLTR